MEPSRTLSVDLPADRLQEAVSSAALEVLKRFLAPPAHREEAGPGWQEVERRVRGEATSLLADWNLRPLVQEALARVAPAVIEAETSAALAKAVQRLLREKPGLILEKARELLGSETVAQEVADAARAPVQEVSRG